MTRLLASLGLVSALLLSPVADAAEEYLNPSTFAAVPAPAPTGIEAPEDETRSDGEWTAGNGAPNATAPSTFASYSYEVMDVFPIPLAQAPAPGETATQVIYEWSGDEDFVFGDEDFGHEPTGSVPSATPLTDDNPNGLLDHDMLGFGPLLFASAAAPVSEDALDGMTP